MTWRPATILLLDNNLAMLSSVMWPTLLLSDIPSTRRNLLFVVVAQEMNTARSHALKQRLRCAALHARKTMNFGYHHQISLAHPIQNQAD